MRLVRLYENAVLALFALILSAGWAYAQVTPPPPDESWSWLYEALRNVDIKVVPIIAMVASGLTQLLKLAKNFGGWIPKLRPFLTGSYGFLLNLLMTILTSVAADWLDGQWSGQEIATLIQAIAAALLGSGFFKFTTFSQNMVYEKFYEKRGLQSPR